MTRNAAPDPLPGIYEHYKGNRYELLHVGRHSETEERFAVYRALYGERGVWLRPLTMWLETVEVGGRSVPRFRPLAGNGSADPE